MEASRNNKFLTVLPAVVLTPVIDPVIVSLDKYFEEAKIKATVTSGYRTPDHQLEIIRQYLTSKGLSKNYPAMVNWKVQSKEQDSTYVWQMGWSNLLNIGVIINPPIAAKVLMNYIHPVSKKNLKGIIINGSSHSLGTAFNIGGITAEPIIQKAIAAKLAGLASYIKERENNALHLNCTPIKK